MLFAIRLIPSYRFVIRKLEADINNSDDCLQEINSEYIYSIKILPVRVYYKSRIMT